MERGYGRSQYSPPRSPMSVTIGYLNVEGLRPEKHQACCSLIDAGVFDVLFLSETWFPKSFNYMSHPYSFCQSSFGRSKENSRPSGGLLAIVAPRIRSLIRSYQVTVEGILLDVDGTKALAVYLPPSLTHSAIEQALDVFPQYSILLGDVNVRFKGVSRAAPSTRTLQDFWQGWLGAKSLSMSKPHMNPYTVTRRHCEAFKQSHSALLSRQFHRTDGDFFDLFPNCELDHLFHSPSVIPDVQLLGTAQFNIKTVHRYFIQCTIPCRTSGEEKELREGLGRFHLEHLEKPEVARFLSRSWSSLDEALDWDITDVDVYDSVLVNSVQAVAEEVLGTYDVLQRRKAPDRVQPLLCSQLSAVAAVRLFKRKQRNSDLSLSIQSRNGVDSAVDECVAKFRSTFNTDCTSVPLPSLSPNDGSQSDRSLLSGLISLVDSSRICGFMDKYPKDKACGIDSIHTLLLTALKATKLSSRLSGLYALCINTGRTPARWNQSVMYLLPKSSEPPITCDSVRPLSILPMFRRIFEGLILPAFTDSTKEYTKLHPAQAGFRKGYSTLTHAAICHHALSIKSTRYAIFLDFKAAYDVTSSEHVMKSLRNRKMPLRLQYLVQSLMFQDGSFRLVVNGDMSCPVERNCGLPQGWSFCAPLTCRLISVSRHIRHVCGHLGSRT